MWLKILLPFLAFVAFAARADLREEVGTSENRLASDTMQSLPDPLAIEAANDSDSATAARRKAGYKRLYLSTKERPVSSLR